MWTEQAHTLKYSANIEVMATRIQSTPVLDRKESRRFSSLVEKNLKSKAHRLPTPKLQKAMKLALRDVIAVDNSK